MRILGESKLNRHGDAILHMRRNGNTIAEILQYLMQNGVSAGQSTVSDWLMKNADKLVHAASPIGNAPSINPTRSSLGLFNGRSDSEEFSQIVGILRILFLPNHDWDEQKIARSIGVDGFGIPMNRDGEPDFTAYARTLRRRRVKSLGDMDFVLLALWTRKVRKTCKKPVSNFAEVRRRAKFILEIASGIRDEMLATF